MRLSGELSCNWLIMLVTMATPTSSHVKDKNSIFIACDEDMIFEQKEKSWYFTSKYTINHHHESILVYRNIGHSSRRTHEFVTEINYGLITVNWDDLPVSGSLLYLYLRVGLV